MLNVLFVNDFPASDLTWQYLCYKESRGEVKVCGVISEQDDYTAATSRHRQNATFYGTVSGGHFHLGLPTKGQFTVAASPDIAYNISNADLKTLLDAFLLAQGYTATVAIGGGPCPTSFTIDFSGADSTAIPLMQCTHSLTGAGAGLYSLKAFNYTKNRVPSMLSAVRDYFRLPAVTIGALRDPNQDYGWRVGDYSFQDTDGSWPWQMFCQQGDSDAEFAEVTSIDSDDAYGQILATNKNVTIMLQGPCVSFAKFLQCGKSFNGETPAELLQNHCAQVIVCAGYYPAGSTHGTNFHIPDNPPANTVYVKQRAASIAAAHYLFPDDATSPIPADVPVIFYGEEMNDSFCYSGVEVLANSHPFYYEALMRDLAGKTYWFAETHGLTELMNMILGIDGFSHAVSAPGYCKVTDAGVQTWTADAAGPHKYINKAQLNGATWTVTGDINGSGPTSGEALEAVWISHALRMFPDYPVPDMGLVIAPDFTVNGTMLYSQMFPSQINYVPDLSGNGRTLDSAGVSRHRYLRNGVIICPGTGYFRRTILDSDTTGGAWMDMASKWAIFLDVYVQNDNAFDATAGSTAAGAIDNASGYGVGAVTLHIDGLSASHIPGDVITLSGTDYTIRAVAAATVDGGTYEQDVTLFLPGLTGAVADNAPVTLKAQVEKTIISYNRDGGNDVGWRVCVKNGRWKFGTHDDDLGAAPAATREGMVISNSVIRNGWTRLCCYHDVRGVSNAGRLSIFVDGTLDSIPIDSKKEYAGAGNFQINGTSIPSSGYSAGIVGKTAAQLPLANIRLYTHVSMDERTIKDKYLATRPDCAARDLRRGKKRGDGATGTYAPGYAF